MDSPSMTPPLLLARDVSIPIATMAGHVAPTTGFAPEVSVGIASFATSAHANVRNAPFIAGAPRARSHAAFQDRAGKGRCPVATWHLPRHSPPRRGVSLRVRELRPHGGL